MSSGDDRYVGLVVEPMLLNRDTNDPLKYDALAHGECPVREEHLVELLARPTNPVDYMTYGVGNTAGEVSGYSRPETPREVFAGIYFRVL